MAGGRPTKYKTEYCDMLVEHFRIQPQIMKSKRTYYASGQLKSEEEYPIAAQLPTFQSFADEIGVNIDTLHEWKDKYKEFSEAYTRAKQLQEHIWLVNGMSNLYNAQFAQFFGKNCLGYKDKTEVESKNDNTNHNFNYSTLCQEALDAIETSQSSQEVLELQNAKNGEEVLRIVGKYRK